MRVNTRSQAPHRLSFGRLAVVLFVVVFLSSAFDVPNTLAPYNPQNFDYDSDGIVDDIDVDDDGDGILDSVEDRNSDGDDDPETNPTDTDGDGMPDAWELNYVGLNPLAKDATGDLDGDGYSNLAEYISGTNPTDESSLPIEIVKTIPHAMAGVDPDQTRVPNDTSFSLLIYAAAGIDCPP